MPREIHWIPDFLGSILIDGVTIEQIISDAVASAGGMDETGVRTVIGDAIIGGTKLTAVVSGAGDEKVTTLNLDELTSADLTDFAAAVNALIAAATIDAATLGGDTKAQIIAAAVASVVGGAAEAYNTLQEIQALMEADDTQTTGMLTSIAARARFFAGALPDGAPTATVTHNLNLTNIHDFKEKIFVSATGAQEEYDIVGATANTATVTDETGANIPAGRRIFIVAGV